VRHVIGRTDALDTVSVIADFSSTITYDSIFLPFFGTETSFLLSPYFYNSFSTSLLASIHPPLGILEHYLDCLIYTPMILTASTRLGARRILGTGTCRSFSAISSSVSSLRHDFPTKQHIRREASSSAAVEASNNTAAFDGTKDSLEQCVIRDLFMSYAKPLHDNGGGDETPCLDIQNLHDLLISIGEHPSPDTLQEIVEAVDHDGNGTIEWHEFMAGCDKILGHHKQDDQYLDVGALIRTFRTLDRDGNGSLTLDELEGLLSAAGGRIEEQDAHEILRLADHDQN